VADFLTISKVDEAFIHILAERWMCQELSDFFSFVVPGCQHMPAFKNKIWDGKIRLFNIMTQQIYAGLLPRVEEFCRAREYDIIYEDEFGANNVLITDIEIFIKSLNLPFPVRDFQQKAVVDCVRDGRQLLISPTASGKSLIIYMLYRWFDVKTLIVVPTTSLVSQMVTDFGEYGYQGDAHKVTAGVEKSTPHQLTVATWQSIYNQSEKWFRQFELVIVDEAHLAKAKSLVAIMTKLKNAKYRFGLTGTLDGTQTNQLVLEGLFGRKNQVTTTAALMANKQVAQLKIKALVLRYSEEDRQLMRQMDYPQERNWIISNPFRNTYIRKLALSLKGNTLILFQYVDRHGKPLYEEILKHANGRGVHFIHGKVDADVREEVRRLIETVDNDIIVASYGTLSTGSNFKNLHNIIFASPSKSLIRVLQSIGRALRLAASKTHATLFDLADDVSWKSHINHTLGHFKERLKIYAMEKFDVKVYNINL